MTVEISYLICYSFATDEIKQMQTYGSDNLIVIVNSLNEGEQKLIASLISRTLAVSNDRL